METSPTKNRLDSLRCCVIIPTYNNHKTIQSVIDKVLVHTKNIIIVNDGSTDTTPQILKKYTNLILIHLSKNKGKGNALRIGFKFAEKLKYKFAITIDSDGQHFPQDIPVFIDALENEFNVKFSLSELTDVENTADIKRHLKSHGVSLDG